MASIDSVRSVPGDGSLVPDLPGVPRVREASAMSEQCCLSDYRMSKDGRYLWVDRRGIAFPCSRPVVWRFDREAFVNTLGNVMPASTSFFCEYHNPGPGLTEEEMRRFGVHLTRLETVDARQLVMALNE